MDKRLGVVGIVIDDLSAAEDVNAVLHEFSSIIIGRMGIPYRERGLSVISIIVDGSMDEISALTGRLGRVKHISVKAALTKDIR
ncbi:MAG: TM1266 family iron-only hydrogenase system putative regulator [Armatimonadota bacterium]